MRTRDNWEQTTLGELVERSGGSIQTGPFGSQLHASDYVPEGVPSVMPANIGENVINDEGIARITEADADRLSRHRMQSGDIVYSRRGDVERRALVRPKNEGWLCGTGCLRVRFGADAPVDARFVSYLLGTPWTREWITQHAVGATMLNLNTTILGAVPLALPSVDEQYAIADVLGALDDKIEANRKLAAIASSLAEVHFRELVATATDSVRLEELLTLEYGKALPATKREPGDVPVFGSGGVVGYHDEAHVQGPGIIVGRKGSVGTVHWAESGFFPIDTVFYVVPHAGIPMTFLHFALRKQRFGERSTDSAVPGLNRGDAYRSTQMVPSAEALVAFDLKVRNLFRLDATLSAESVKLAILRDAILPKLMSGQLGVAGAMKLVSA